MIGKPPKGSASSPPPSNGNQRSHLQGNENLARLDINPAATPPLHDPSSPQTPRPASPLSAEAPIAPPLSISRLPGTSALVEAIAIPAARPLSDYWINSAAVLPAAGPQGFRVFRRRRYVELSDGHFVQVALDPVANQWRATLASERIPSGPVLLPGPDGVHWQLQEAPAHAHDHDVEIFDPESSSGLSAALVSQSSIELRVRALYPGLPDDELATFIGERLQVDPLRVLSALENESVTLRDDLQRWCAAAPEPHPGSPAPGRGETLAAERDNRQRFSDQLQAIWRRESVLADEFADHYFSSFVDFPGRLPELTARFEWVTELVLSSRGMSVELGRFLECFPNVRYLTLENIRMETFSPAIFQMRDLQQLTLNGCSLRLDEHTAEGLSRIDTLTLLDLSDNPLGIAPSVDFMHGLRELSLRDTELTRVPSGIEHLAALTRVDLRDNSIVELHAELFDLPDTQNLFLDLIGNPLGEVAQRQISDYLQGASLDRRVNIRMDEGEIEEVVSSSDSSDSGMESDS
ncbi:hypothetical protein [Pseudomonas sp.]|jgi:hypothetical protein|uniref:leucine-rich repeat domain-containing protein n=1 Tax=Pseudomonas sp. TaxID=306 RepID=UPI002E32FAA3|nr:hypothetical protein [Pseudomonas sp.]HEX4551417.1 hypothetical protein [Pseudomonas sp.]